MTRSAFLRIAPALILGLMLAAVPAVSETEAPETPIVAKVHADWCGTCTKLETTWTELQTRYGDDVRFVVLDVTDRDTLTVAQAEADRLGIRGFFDHYKGTTGVIGIIDPTTGGAEVLKGELDADRYAAPIAAALEAS
jgi:thiol-disulfide isomerase/thioredoxin